MSIERINFTSSLLDKARFNTQLKPTEPKQPAEETKETSADITEDKNTEAQNEPETEAETVAAYSTEPQKHTARNWTVGLSAAAVLTALGVVYGRRGYLGEGVQKMLKGTKKETSEIIDDISESASSTVRKSSSESSGLHVETPASEESTVLGHISEEDKGLHVTTTNEESGNILGRNADEVSEQEPLVTSTVVDDAEESVSTVLPKIDDEPLIVEDVITEIFSKDGKFKIPMSKDEIDMKATRKYLKAKKVKVPRKYKKLPELKIEKVLGDFKPENVDKTKINGGVYIHQLPKGERLEVHYDWTNNNITYIDRFNAKDVNTGYVGYKRDEAGKFEFVELPNGYKYRFNDDGALAYGERCNGTDSYIYDRFGLLKRIDQKISDNVERKVFMRLNGKIDYVNYYVNTTEGQKLVKEDIYFHDENKIEEWFDANGDEDISIYGKSSSISTLAKLKFWKSDWFKKLGKKAEQIILEEDDV